MAARVWALWAPQDAFDGCRVNLRNPLDRGGVLLAYFRLPGIVPASGANPRQPRHPVRGGLRVKTADLHRALTGRSPFDRLMRSHLGQELREKAARNAERLDHRAAEQRPDAFEVGRTRGLIRRVAERLAD